MNSFKPGDKVKRIKNHTYNSLFRTDVNRVFTVRYCVEYELSLIEDPEDHAFLPCCFELVEASSTPDAPESVKLTSQNINVSLTTSNVSLTTSEVIYIVCGLQRSRLSGPEEYKQQIKRIIEKFQAAYPSDEDLEHA